MSARFAALALVAAAAAGCGGDVYTVDVHPATVLGCGRALEPLQSVKVEVIEKTNQGLEQIARLDSCVSLPATREVGAILHAFDETGVIIEGVPAESTTLLRFVAHHRDQCWEDTEEVCGITCPPVRADELPAEGVTANFICRPLFPDSDRDAARLYGACRNLELLTEEQQANICSRVE